MNLYTVGCVNKNIFPRMKMKIEIHVFLGFIYWLDHTSVQLGVVFDEQTT